MQLITRGRVLTFIVVVALLAINVVALRWSTHLLPDDKDKHDKALLRYGDRAPAIKGPSLLGKGAVEWTTSSPANLVLYFSSLQSLGSSTELVKYAEILSQRHKKDGLGITAVVKKDVGDIKPLVEQSVISYDVIVDEDGAILEQLGLQPGENGAFVFDQQGLCRFSTRRPVTGEDLRQLVAMELLHVDPFTAQAGTEAVLKKGKSLRSVRLLDARSLTATLMDQIRSGAGAAMHYVLFTADCSVCSLPRYLDQFEKFRREHLKGDAVLIFDFNFSRTDVLQQLQIKGIDAPAYIANEQLPGLEYTNHNHEHEKSVAIVQTDARRTVLNISSLNSYVPPPQATPPGSSTASYEKVFGDIPMAAYDVATYQGRYFLSDIEGNRIVVVNDKMQIERDFGRIGSGPGRLFHPGYLDVGRDGTIFVEDGGNERIVKFDQQGNYLGEFRLTDYQGFAVGAQNELYVGQPDQGHLITVYSSSGKKLRSFGQLKKFSDVHGPAVRDKDIQFRIAFNRVRLTTGQNGDLYVSFMLTPLIQKYNAEGTLLFERRLEAPEIDRLLEAIEKKKYIGTKSDGADARIVALDPVIDPASGNIMVPLVDGSIYVADREGNKLMLLRPTWTAEGDGTFYPFVAGLGAKGEFLVTPFPPKNWYRLVTPQSSVAAE